MRLDNERINITKPVEDDNDTFMNLLITITDRGSTTSLMMKFTLKLQIDGNETFAS